ncbi:MAG TPA: hypothetical protein VIY48_06535 [Candidatus Paceibacterota bacterium]
MLRKSICDFFDVGDFAEFLGITVDDLIEAFPDNVDDVLDDVKELMQYNNEAENDNDN